MKTEMQFQVILFLALPVLVLSFDCTGQSDGHYEISCKSYFVCSGGFGQLVECPIGQVYSHNHSVCYDESKVGTPCGLFRDCSNKADGRYADIEFNCESYYTCHNGHYYGHEFCSAGTVFDEESAFCNWPHNVKPPCGTSAK